MSKLNRPERLRVFAGALLEHDEDPELQKLVDEACAHFKTPIALVSFVMGATQFFRAARGLPADLRVSLATSRCDSFCQFVVKDEAVLAVSDAKASKQLPQKLVESYGIRSYLGAPLHFLNEVIGSFCVIDIETRAFDDEDRATISSFAQRATARLETLAETKVPVEEIDVAREIAIIDRALAELGPIFRLAGAFSRDELSAEDAVRGMTVLAELETIFPEVRERLRKVRRAVEP